MKKLLIVLMLLNFNNCLAQKNIFFGLSIDPTMLVNGPTSDYYDVDSSINIEFIAGWEESFNDFNGLRVSHKYEIHNAIDYAKATWIAADYVLYDHILWFEVDNFNQYAGLEISTIYRTDPNYDVNSPDHYIEKPTSLLTPGANFELQYLINDHLSIAAGFNIFRAEHILIIDGKDIRTDGMITMYLKI